MELKGGDTRRINPWADFVTWARSNLLRPGFELATPGDIEIPRCVDTADEAVALLRPHYDKWLHEYSK